MKNFWEALSKSTSRIEIRKMNKVEKAEITDKKIRK
jgi:hypothetical protein